MKQKLLFRSQSTMQYLWRGLLLVLLTLLSLPLRAQVDESKVITMTTERARGSKIGLAIIATGDVHIEGVKEEYQPPTSWFDRQKFYTLTSQSIKIIGDVTTLEVGGNSLTSLDVRGVPSLDTLSAEGNLLTNIDLSGNDRLTWVNLDRNKITELDLSSNVRLIQLRCSDNRLQSLDLSRLENLQFITCSKNSLSRLNLPNSSALTGIGIFSNRLGLAQMRLIIDRLPEIEDTERGKLWVGHLSVVDKKDNNEANQISKSLVEKAKSKGWKVRDHNNNVDEFGNRTWLGIPYEGEDFVDESKVITFTTNMAVGQKIQLDLTPTEPLRLEGILEPFETVDNPNVISQGGQYTLTSQTVRIVGATKSFGVGGCEVEQLDVTGNTMLESLSCYQNRLRRLDVSNNRLLRELDCSDNDLVRLDLSNNTRLTHLDCSGNEISRLDLSNNSSLRHIKLYYNRLADMSELVNSLPLVTSDNGEYLGAFVAVDKKNPDEGNRITRQIANRAKEKGWKVRDRNGGVDAQGNYNLNRGIPYDGEAEIDESKVITFTTAKAVGEIVSLNIVADGDVRIEGVQEAYQPSANYYEPGKSYTLTSQTVRIVGDVRDISLNNNQITALDVRQATNLRRLFAGSNQLRSIDVSQNAELTWLAVRDNQLTTLDITRNKVLFVLICDRNQLTELDLSNNRSLSSVNCERNQITSLDLSKLPNLYGLACSGQKLRNLDLSHNPKLTQLTCYENGLTSLDLSNNPELFALRCSGNKLTRLDLSKHSKLEELECSNNQLSQLDLTGKPQLMRVVIHNNRIGLEQMNRIAEALYPVDLTNVEEYRRQWVGLFIAVDKTNPNEGNRLGRAAARIAKEKGWKVQNYNGGKNAEGHNDWRGVPYEGEDFVDESKYITFTTAKAVGETIEFDLRSDEDVRFEGAEVVSRGLGEREWVCRLTSQTVRIVGAVKMIYLEKNRLTSVDVTRNSILERLDVEDNELTQIDVTQNPLLDHLNCNANRLTSLDLTKNPRLIELDCDDNQLTSLDVSQNVTLREFDCRRNQITGLDLSKNIDLRQLHCSHNKIKQLDLSGSGTLRRVDCSYNELERIRVAPDLRATATTSPLVGLDCSHNRLTSLDLSEATKLERLDASYNRLSRLDLGQMDELASLRVQINRLGYEAMQAIVAKLPKQEHTTFVAVDKTNPEEGNYINRDAVTAARAKGWQVRDANDGKDASGMPSQDGIPYDGAATDALDTLEARGVRLYPNPASSFIVIDGVAAGERVCIYSLDGILLQDQILKEANERIELRSKDSNVYIVRVSGQSHRLVVEK